MKAAAPGRNERRLVTYLDFSGTPRFLMTGDREKGLFYLYELSGENASRLGRDKSPAALEAKYRVNEIISEKAGKKK